MTHYPITLRAMADQLAISQLVQFKDQCDALDALDELLDDETEGGTLVDDAVTFQVMGHMSGLTFDELYGRLEIEAEAILARLEMAYQMGRCDEEKGFTVPKGERRVVTAGHANVLINAEGDGVVVDIFPVGSEEGESVASTWAHDNDLTDDEED